MTRLALLENSQVL